jgi:hypothetical protein
VPDRELNGKLLHTEKVLVTNVPAIKNMIVLSAVGLAKHCCLFSASSAAGKDERATIKWSRRRSRQRTR